MVCYSVAVISSLIVFALRKRFIADSVNLHNLNLLLNGGSLMLLIDHAWNKELFFSKDLASDLFLGVLMTAGIIVFWGITVFASKKTVLAKTRA